jgi:uncharacterized RDD family membrane protein YckC
LGEPPINLGDTSTAGLVSTICFFALYGLQSYHIARSGQSLGKRFVGTKIVAVDGSRPSFVQAVLVRTWLVVLLPFVPAGGSLLAVLDVLFIFGRSRRCLHDRAAGTRVIRTD